MISKITFTALILASTIGICPMQLEIPLMDHSQMNMDMEKGAPCDDCVSASENNVLKDTQISDSNPPLITAAILPTESLSDFALDNEFNTASQNEDGPNSQAPPLVGTVILRV
ncbi:MAG: hypothetical protein ABIA92_04060 [Patescibacteria group bacterium]